MPRPPGRVAENIYTHARTHRQPWQQFQHHIEPRANLFSFFLSLSQIAFYENTRWPHTNCWPQAVNWLLGACAGESCVSTHTHTHTNTHACTHMHTRTNNAHVECDSRAVVAAMMWDASHANLTEKSLVGESPGMKCGYFLKSSTNTCKQKQKETYLFLLKTWTIKLWGNNPKHLIQIN